MNRDPGIANSDHRPILEEIRLRSGEQGVAAAVKHEMAAILRHCIECDWGACYNTKFEELVWPYLDSVAALDAVLRSDAIRSTGDVRVGRTGARIFPELLSKLRRCRDQNIKRYLRHEFSHETLLN